MQKVLNKAYAILSRRNHTVFEIKEKLLKAGFENGEIEPALIDLTEKNFLNDRQMAESVINRYKNKGNRWITMKCKQKGIAETDFIDILNSLEPELERAYFEIEKNLRTIKFKKENEIPEKIARYLAYRGYNSTTCWQVANNYNKRAV